MNRYRSARPVRRPEYWAVVLSVVIAGVCFYGIRAAAIYGLAAVTAVVTDFACLFLKGKSYRVVDLSNIGNALILAMLFPASVPYSIVLLSTVFAVGVTHIFGYRHDLLFPPAAAGYLFAVLCWRDEVLLCPAAGERLALFGSRAEVAASFSAEVDQNAGIRTSAFDILIGAVRTQLGTGCLLLLIVGIVVLVLRRQLSFWGVLGYFVGTVLIVLAFGAPLQAMAGNMFLFSMLFLVADPCVMPGGVVTDHVAALVTGIAAGFLLAEYQLEYAPVTAVMLTCPIWQMLYRFENDRTRTERKQVETE